MEKCYMCSNISVSKEHVPPKCLFPENKDLPAGIFLRKDLITVPSCEIHNMAKSKDDEYLLYILCMNISNNDTAFSHFSSKILRSFKRRPRLMESITRNSRKIIAIDSAGNAMNSLMIKSDIKRITKCFNQIARGLYFHEYGKPFEGECRIIHDCTIQYETNFEVLVESGEKSQHALEYIKEFFHELGHEGENDRVFRYRFEEPDEHGLIALSMQFYGGSNVFVAYSPSPKAA